MCDNSNKSTIVDLSQLMVADNNLFTRNKYKAHETDGYATEVFILVNGGTGTRVVQLGGSGGGRSGSDISSLSTLPFIECVASTPFTFVPTNVIKRLLLNAKDEESKTCEAERFVCDKLNNSINGATDKRSDAVVLVSCGTSSSTQTDEILFQALVQNSNIDSSFRRDFPHVAFIVLGANSISPPPQMNVSTTPPPQVWKAVVAPTKLVSSIFNDETSPSVAPCRLFLYNTATSETDLDRKWVDCSHIVNSNSPFFPGGQSPLRCPASRNKLLDNDGESYPSASNGTHAHAHGAPPPAREVTVTGCDVGTHMDSPCHFYKELPSISHLPPETMVNVPLILVDVSPQCAAHEERAKRLGTSSSPVGDYTITVEDLKAVGVDDIQWEGALVLAHTGWWKRFVEAQQTKNADIYKHGPLQNEQLAMTDLSLWFPGFSKEAAGWLLERGVNGIGIDTLSLDCGSSVEFPVHQIMLGAGKFQIENINFADLNVLGHMKGRAIAAPMLAEGAFEAQTRLLLQAILI